MNKLKIIITLSLVIAIFKLTIAQNPFTVNSEWYYTNREGSSLPNTGYLYQNIDKDTVVQGKDCKKINRTIFHSDGSSETISSEIIFLDANKTYYLLNDKFRILYDFDKQEGDTIYMHEPYYTGITSDSTFMIVIDSVKYENINGFNLKVLYQHSVFNGAGWRFDGKVIETIGCLDSFLPYNELDCDVGNCFSPIRCAENSNIGFIKFSEIDCNFITTHILEPYNDEINIYPNPSKSFINICSNHKILKIEIINSLGQLLTHYTEINENIFLLDMTKNNSGIYFIKVYTLYGVFVSNIIKSK